MVYEATKENYDDFLVKEVTIYKRRLPVNKQAEAFAAIRMNGKRIKVKLDTGAEVMPLRVLNLISDNETKMTITEVKLNEYVGENIPLKGTVTV